MWLRVPPFLFEHIFVQCSSVIMNYYATGFHSLMSCFCTKTAPIPYDEVSTGTLVGFDWLYRHKTGVELNLDLISWNDFWWAWSQTHAFFLLSRSLRGLVVSARSGENLLNWLHMPRNHLRLLTDLGSSMSCTACTFSGSGIMPSWSMIWPRNFTELVENTHFSLLWVTWNFCNCSCIAIKRSSCSYWFDPWMRISSIRHVTTARPSRAVDILVGIIQAQTKYQKGNWLKQNLPNGIIKVVNKADCLDSSICQNPELASNLLNTLALLNWVRVWSTDDKICLSLLTHLFRCVRSTQIRLPCLALEPKPYLSTSL